jgi:hypothetical protein
MTRLHRRIMAHVVPHLTLARLRSNRQRAFGFAVIGLWLIILAGWAFAAYSTELVDSYAKCAEEGYPISDTNPVTCSAGGHTFLGQRSASAPASTEPAVGESVPFDILVNGDSHSNYPNRQEVLITQAAWGQYWRSIHAGQKTLPPLIPVDFTQSNVVALSEGRRGTGGYNLKVTSIVKTEQGTVVNVTESVPTITCRVAQSVTNRYFIVRTPVLQAPVSFRITVDRHHCE